MRHDLPSGTVTFLFTDVEGSTRLLHELGAERYAMALADHRRIIREACAAEMGVEVDTQGDSFFFVFPAAEGALRAAGIFTEALASGPIKVRVGLHTGKPLLTEEGYVGDDVHYAARIASAGHGGQVILSAATAVLVDTVDVETLVKDLGEHRLKDIAEAVPIFQAGDGSFPPLKTISNTNLPRPASTFVGRGRELADVLAKVAHGARLLTLTGAGGSGKTRLAIEAAASLVPSYKAGVFWVSLASLRDPALVAETISQTLGSKKGVAEHIGEREMLLLLDNLEQVIEAAPALSALLESCPNLTLLVTSRELLRIRGEVEYAVLPLAQPEAVTLFCLRAELEPNHDIAELCARLDNLPLAVELAAARTKALSPGQILARLGQRLDLLLGGRDADPRQQTLRATIEWSYGLLSDQEKRLFGRLAVFRGGCTLETAEEVCNGDLDTLQSLVEKSLLRFGDERCWMLETISEYARERLQESGDEGRLRQRHAQWFLALAEEAALDLEHHPEAWLGRLESDSDNFRAALDWLEASAEFQLALRLAGSLAGFWETAYVAEGRQRLERLLSMDEGRTAARAKALLGASILARQSGDPTKTRQRAEEARALYMEFGDSWGAANAGVLLGLADADEHDFESAKQLFEDSAQVFREVGDQEAALFPARLLGWMYDELGDRKRARAVHNENLARARAIGNKQIEGQTLGALASHAVDEGRAADAVSMYKEVLRIDRDQGLHLQTALDLTRFARAVALAGEAPDLAARLLSCADTVRKDMGAGTPPPYVETLREEAISAVRNQLDDAAFAQAWEQGTALALFQAVELALEYAE